MLTRTATIVIDLGFGDAGKGSIVDYLCSTRRISAVVRFNGGSQAAHNVVTPDGRHHTFAQLGSGSFVPGVRTHLSRFMLVDPMSLHAEAQHLIRLGVRDVYERLSIDRGAMIVTPYHKAANRIREFLRGSGNHGSCGMGVGETMMDSISFPLRTVRAADLKDHAALEAKFGFFRKLKYDEFVHELTKITEPWLQHEVRVLTDPDSPRICATSYHDAGRNPHIVEPGYLSKLSLTGDLVFEGAQGVLLDEWHGFHPYTTWSTTTPDNARTLLSEIGFKGTIETIGVVRAYQTRHGRGPFVSEDAGLTSLIPDAYNGNGRWQGDFRIGWSDMVMARYARAVVGHLDSIAVTNLDRIRQLPRVRYAVAYRTQALTRPESQTVVLDTQGNVRALKRKPMLTDLTYQESMTSVLNKASPVYQMYTDDASFFTMLEQELSAPVSIASYGPTYLDKRTRALSRLAA